MGNDKNAIYAGSFDPFTNGHLYIIKQACEIFDFLYIILAANNNKKRQYRVDLMNTAMESTIINSGITNFKIIATDALIADMASQLNCFYLVRGLRNYNDFSYEENIAKINTELNPDLRTLYLRADNEIISSSFVKEMVNFNKDVSKYVSLQVLDVMNNTVK